MPPLPKKKTSKSRQGRRRSQISARVPTNLIVCPQCRSPRPSHRACPICGTYRGREVLDVTSRAARRGAGGE